jgi:hypothetical protein
MKNHDRFSGDDDALDRLIRERLAALQGFKAPKGAVDSVYRRIKDADASSATAPFRRPHTFGFNWRLVFSVLTACIMTAALTFVLTRSLTESEVEKTYIIRFVYENNSAETVTLMGDFNNWREDTMMYRVAETSYWTAQVELAEGVYKYGFLIDGEEWTSDPLASLRVEDSYGNENSLIVLVDDAEKRTHL